MTTTWSTYSRAPLTTRSDRVRLVERRDHGDDERCRCVTSRHRVGGHHGNLLTWRNARTGGRAVVSANHVDDLADIESINRGLYRTRGPVHRVSVSRMLDWPWRGTRLPPHAERRVRRPRVEELPPLPRAESVPQGGRAPWTAGALRRVLRAQGCLVRGRPRLDVRHHRFQRVGQEHVAQVPRRHPVPGEGQRHVARAGFRHCSNSAPGSTPS